MRSKYHDPVLDTVLSVLGELDPASIQTKLQLQRPDVRIRDPSTNTITGSTRSDVPDLISLHATLASSGTFSYMYRRGQPFPGTPSLAWTINCEFAELRLVSPSGTNFEPRADDPPLTIQVHWFDTNEVEEVPWQWNSQQAELPVPARNVFSTLLAFANGNEPGNGWVSIEDAAGRARTIEGFFKQWDESH